MTRLFAFTLLLAACFPQPHVDVQPDGDGGYPPIGSTADSHPDDSPEAASSPCGKACANLKKIACPDGASPNCYRGCVKQASLERIPVTCWIDATTVAAARACGPQLRCIP